ncbi:unnamed protein product, partial [Ectocarpus sp. 4 AP-2014]
MAEICPQGHGKVTDDSSSSTGTHHHLWICAIRSDFHEHTMREGVQLVARPHDAPHEVPDNGHPPYWGGGEATATPRICACSKGV